MKSLKEINVLSMDSRMKLAKETTRNGVVEYLACDEDCWVRAGIAQRENLCQELINKLACDENHYVRVAIVEMKEINYKKFI